MNIRLYADDLKSALKERSEKRDESWAHAACTYTRFIHLGIWQLGPPSKYVETEIIPLLREARQEVSRLLDIEQPKEIDRRRLARYAENIELRIGNLENRYLQSKSSKFIPDDGLIEGESYTS